MQINKKKIARAALCAALTLALGYSFAAKAIETKLIPFQGRLTDANGKTIADGALVVQFKLYDAPVGGQAVWNGEIQKLSVNGGLVNTVLGTKSSLKKVDFSESTYLEITIDANNDGKIGPEDPPLLPRQSIIPAVFAAQAAEAKNAEKLNGYDWSVVFSDGDPNDGIPGGKLKNGSIPATKIAGKSITASQIADSAITSAKIANGTITGDKIANKTITGDKIADSALSLDLLGLSEAEKKGLLRSLEEYSWRYSQPKEGKNWGVPLNDGSFIEMIWVEPGTFMMGSPTDELGRQANEIQHKVTLTKGYWLGKYEVTQDQWETVVGGNPSYFKGGNRPVETLTYANALTFCKLLTEKERNEGRLSDKYEYTLPTEAQWEYACRAGTTTALNNGKELTATGTCPNLDEVGWYSGNSGISTHAVGMKKANAWGFYDMHGNVTEWCLDWYGAYIGDEVIDPVGPSTGSYRVIRGGNWNYTSAQCRSAYRPSLALPTYADYRNGFRLALVPVQ